MSQAALNEPAAPAAKPEAPASPAAAAAPPAAGPPAASTPLGYSRPGGASRKPGINYRLVLFLIVLAAPFIWILYVFLQQLTSGGITRHGDVAEVDLKALGNFPFNKETGKLEDVPQRWRELDGKKVVLQGYMYSGKSAAKTGASFEFVYNIGKCCFGGPPLVQERVFGHPAPKSSDPVQIYDQDQFVKLTGILHVRVIKDRDVGTVMSLYDLDVLEAEPL